MTAILPWRRKSTEERLFGFLTQWLVLAAGVWVAAELLDGIRYQGWQGIALVSLVLGLINVFIRPILVVLSFPMTVLTLGLFILIVNAIAFWLAAEVAGQFDPVRFSIDHFFWDAVFGALIVTVVGWVVRRLVR
jgi:putative membrane protein